MRMYTAVSRKVVQPESIKAYATIPKGIMVCGRSYPHNNIKMRRRMYISKLSYKQQDSLVYV